MKPQNFVLFSFILVVFFLLSFDSHAQVGKQDSVVVEPILPLLKPEEAVNIALERNLGIQAAKLQTDAAYLQVFKGNAGMLPKVDGYISPVVSGSDILQKLSNGTVTDRFATTMNPAANVAMSWTLYDGRKMYATYDRLKEQGNLSNLQTRLVMETTIANVLNAYYQVMLQKQTLKYLQQIIIQYEEVLKITDDRWQFGKGSKIDYLQAKTDLNAQVTLLLNAQNALKNSKAVLNQLLARSPEQEFDVLETLKRTYNPNLETLKLEAQANNKNLLILRKNAEIIGYTRKEAEALKLPKIVLNGNYGYSLSKSNAGLFLFNQSLGLTTGITLSWNIYNGEITRRQIQTAKINANVNQKQQEDLMLQLESNLVQAYNQFQTDKQQLALELENNKIAEENLTIALEKFKLGASTILDIIQAQKSFDASLNRLVNVRYAVKVDELNLLILSGGLVK